MDALPGSTRPPASVQGLLDLLEKAEGSVQVLDPPAQARAAWRRLIHALRSGGHVPKGWHLVHRGRNTGDLVIELRRGRHPSKQYQPVNRSSVPVPEFLVDPHPVIDRLREQPSRLPESDESRSRTLMLLQALCVEAEKRAWAVRWGTDALLSVVVDEQPLEVRPREDQGARWTLRLVLTVTDADAGVAEWKDYARKRLEDELFAILTDLRQRGRDYVTAAEAAERAEQARLQQERDRAVTAHRDQILRQQVAAWLLAEDIRSYCTDLVTAGMRIDDPWLAWAHTYADDLDPLADPPGSPDDPPPSEAVPAPRQQHAEKTASTPPPYQPWHPNRRWYHG
ncbi:hypothetical protein ACQEVC_12580 [Plantactinospora sp. CA-294935]|uniref:hypothetical protein n=1 Tax=Plantactinospora sp. CA-294935 TaxID=3240012 RepID=UPI003D8D3001